MGLTYRNGRPYYRRSIRRNGRCTSEYVASGELALINAILDADKRFVRQQFLDEQRRSDELDQALGAMAKRAKGLAHDALVAAGFHHHHRSEWRRNVSQDRDIAKAENPHSDSTALAARRVGDRTMDWKATELLIESMAGRDAPPERRQEYRREIDDYAAELAGPSPTPIERALAEVAATSWFALRTAEMLCGAADSARFTGAQAEPYHRRLDRAHRRYLNTIKLLAVVRRLAVPAVQINLARQQVNQVNVGDPA
jgi:hypothetical protein